jgi:hypothetical protein
MTFLPIVERELRVAARLRGSYWSRFAAAGLGVLLTFWALWATRQAPSTLSGAVLFKTLGVALFIYAAAAGTRLTTDCLSEEKREGTLGLLFLTDLKGYDVVFGKLAACSVNAFYGMLAVVPVLAISLLLGGVTRGEFWRVVLVALNLLFFFLSIGIFASAVCRQDSRAMALTLLLGANFVGASLIWVGWQEGRHGNYDFRGAMLPCPAFACFAAFDSAYAMVTPPFFWFNVAITHLYGWIFLLLSCWIVPRSWQDEASGGRRRLPKAKFASRDQSSRDLLETNPFLWRAGCRPLKLWVTIGLMVLLWIWLSFRFELDTFEPIKDIFIISTLSVLFKIQLAGEASRALSQDRRSGALELLLTTPLTAPEIIEGQRNALWRQFAWPVGVVLVMNFIFMALEKDQFKGQNWMHVTLAIFLVLDLNALSWTSMWLALKTRNPGQAALRALATIVGLPIAALLLAVPILEGLSWPSALFIVGVLGLAIDIGFGQNAEYKLATEFRTIITERLSSKAQRSLVSNPATTGR